jgi:hypothetical protein
LDGKPEIILRLSAPISEVKIWHEELKDLAVMDVEIKKHRNRRSLDSNAYLWVLCSKLAAVLRTSKDEVYLTMLERYGVFTHIIVKPQIVARVKAEWRTVKELGEVTIGGQKGIQLQCYFGSHTYDTKEMGVLIDGIVSECKELDIETLSPAELERMKNEWGKEG